MNGKYVYNNNVSGQDIQEVYDILIEGVTESGEIFRPADWAERMSGKLSTFENNRIHYSPLLQPLVQDGHKCVLVDHRLKQSNPELYTSIMEFAQSNHLKQSKKEVK